LAVAVGLAMTSVANAAIVGYDIAITTFYQFGIPGDLTFSDFGVASPDTGYWRVTNQGTTTFSGTIGQTAVSSFGGDFSYSHAVNLAPGGSLVFAVNSEASNQGGYNGPFGITQPGVIIYLTGLFNGTEAVALSVADKDIHSGVVRINPFGELVDSYVLQGGDSLGRDTGDDFEVTQAPGHYQFVETVSVPEPGTSWLLALGCLALGRRMRRATR
jgi:hypothetical protein